MSTPIETLPPAPVEDIMPPPKTILVTAPKLTGGMERKDVIANQWRNFRSCPKCSAKIGTACRMPTCPQLQNAPLEERPKT